MSFNISRNTGSNAKIEFLVEDRVVLNDTNLIDGRKSTGKSSVVCKIIADWFHNKSLSDPNRLKGVLWLSSEENFDTTIKPRLMYYGLTEDMVSTIDYKNGKSPRPILPQDLDKLVEFCKQHGINCVVVDPFSELKPSAWSINDGDQMREYMTAIAALCTRANVTAFVMRHMRKSNGPYSGDDGIGSVMIANTVRLRTRLDVSSEADSRRFWTVQESNIVRPSFPMAYEFKATDRTFGEVVWKGEQQITIEEIKKLSEEDVKRMKMEDAKRLLLEALKEGPKPCVDLIDEAETFGIGERTLAEAKARLKIWSDRLKDTSSGKMYWVWGLAEHKPTNTTNTPTDTGMQLTLQELPPVNDETNEATPVVSPDAVQGTPSAGESPADQAARMQADTDGVRKTPKRRKPQAKPVNPEEKPEPKGKGRGKKNPPAK